jgi:hypothetical protein
MKITICGSSTFMKEMVEFRNKLNQMGHDAILHQIYVDWVNGKNLKLRKKLETEHAEVKKKLDVFKWYYNSIVNSDAILVLNFTKNGVENYIGGNVLMEMGFAYVNDKKIFLLNPVPEIGHKDEIVAMDPIVLNGDLNKIGDSA